MGRRHGAGRDTPTGPRRTVSRARHRLRRAPSRPRSAGDADRAGPGELLPPLPPAGSGDTPGRRPAAAYPAYADWQRIVVPTTRASRPGPSAVRGRPRPASRLSGAPEALVKDRGPCRRRRHAQARDPRPPGQGRARRAAPAGLLGRDRRPPGQAVRARDRRRDHRRGARRGREDGRDAALQPGDRELRGPGRGRPQ